MFLNYISNLEYDSSTIGQVRGKLHRYIADIVSDIIIEDLQSHMVERFNRMNTFTLDEKSVIRSYGTP